MPRRRQVLDLLFCDEPVELIERHDLFVWDHSSKARLAETLDRPRLAPLT
jgi:hypothetical protein